MRVGGPDGVHISFASTYAGKRGVSSLQGWSKDLHNKRNKTNYSWAYKIDNKTTECVEFSRLVKTIAQQNTKTVGPTGVTIKQRGASSSQGWSK